MFGVRQLGSPPQVRGKQKGCHPSRHEDRITPAGAGKTCLVNVMVFTEGDHPRRCGENYRGWSYCPIIKGSPPQVRGKLMSLHVAKTNDGITPADAGKTNQHAH